MPDVTFVITTRNNAGTIAACVSSCRSQEGAASEVIVVDNHSTDGTAATAERAGAHRVITAGPERSAQRNLGIRLAAAPLVVIVDSDMTASPDLARSVTEAFTDAALGAVVVPELAEGRGWWAEARKLEKRLYVGDATVEAARAFRVDAVQQAGGYDEDLVGGEDWDLPDRVVAAGWGLGRASGRLYHHEQAEVLRALFVKKRYYGRGLAEYRRRAGDRARPLGRASLLRRPDELARRPGAAAALALIKCVEASGIALGMRDHRRSLVP